MATDSSPGSGEGGTLIGTTTVPNEYVQDVKNAAAALGIPAAIVAAQINYESGFDPTALSPTGAQGIAQFEPYTWTSYGTGSPDNPGDAFAAYTKYMGVLLKQENGNVYNALAAYNAGPGNLSAGDGYAQHIFSVAGYLKGLLQGAAGKLPTAPNGATEGGTAAAGTAAGTGAWTSALGTVWNDTGGSLLSIPGAITGTFGDIDTVVGKFYDGAKLFFQPSTQVRIGAGVFGFVFIIVAIVFLAKEANA
jgi:Transglycosylase SLT domain